MPSKPKYACEDCGRPAWSTVCNRCRDRFTDEKLVAMITAQLPTMPDAAIGEIKEGSTARLLPAYHRVIRFTKRLNGKYLH